ncbi:sulfatase [Candidatus Nitrosotenuis cloacae]|uniref:sulfatase family protein n=1 Tax=Candidatus Nitrosotenuis cloacae TaxID=1603555 RepID=UPI00227FAD0B|nr:sulfatase-like hydrolase/transferase [Candidatus Nitrosotenuis cloacae]
MNVIFITMDGARLDRIVNGVNYKKLIEKSAFFSKVIAYAPYTIAAMHAIFSGTYGNKTGVDSYWSNVHFKKDKYKTLTKYLQDAHYVTYGDVINKLVLPPSGFDQLIVHDELHDNLTIRHISLIDRMNLLRKEGKKFFLYLHYSNIHTGIMQEVLQKYNNFSTEYFSNRKKNEEYYDKLFLAADDYLGQIITHCEKIGIIDDTLIVVISDHGISVGEKIGERAYGVFCYDYTINSTALFYHKSLLPKLVNEQVRSIDVLPTILEILTIPIDPDYTVFQGESLIPFLYGKGKSRIAFSQSGNPLDTNRPPEKPNVWAIRTPQWKFIKNIHNKSEELYYLVDDPSEEKNVLSKFPEKAQEMRLELDRILADA